MIYTNFLFFIVALALLTMSPAEGKQAMSTGFKISGIALGAAVFWQAVRYKFLRLKQHLLEDQISVYEAKRRYATLVNFFTTIALLLFALDILVFDLKHLLVITPFGHLDTFINIAGLAIFIIYLVTVWYWAYESMGHVLAVGRSHRDYIKGNLKFNLAILIPWLCYLIIYDILRILAEPLYLELEGSIFSQVLFFGIFLIILLVIAPLFITRLWDCRPLQDPGLIHMIATFNQSQGVKFKEVMSWNALNGTLVTAGVIGLLYPFRYLLLSPELIRLLDKEEIMGVVSHEVGHVKKKHLLYYLLVFVGMMILWNMTTQWLQMLAFYILPISMITDGTVHFFSIALSLVMLLLYFRFIFGYFMRNFERQADIYCFECGVDPNWLIGSFTKLAGYIGDDGKKANWHHYNIPQRIGFLRRCIEDQGAVNQHHKKVRKRLSALFVSLAGIVGISFLSPVLPLPGLQEKINQVNEMRVLEAINKEPQNYLLFAYLGELSYQMEKWEQAQKAYERSLFLNDRQPSILNNLAWLYLTCPEKRIRDHQRALKLAIAAEQLETTPEVLDTLAEAYFQNSMYDKAYESAKLALALTKENLSHFKAQYKKMKKYYLQLKDSIKI